MWNRPQYLFLFLLFTGLSACSSSQPSSDPMLESELGSSSGADAVGSVPEDMLVADEKSGEAAAVSGSDTAETAADPFEDLQDKTQEASADSSSEEGSGSGGGVETYTVKSGDTLMKISFNLYGDIDRWKEIFDMNKNVIKKASQLKAGMQLKYEAPSSPFQPDQLAHTYEIKKGDTLANIADEVYGRKMKYKKLQKFNPSLIRNPNRIFAGFTLFYDITEQEVAEAEARRKEKMAGNTVSDSVPSLLDPPPSDLKAKAPTVSVAPSAPPPESDATVPPAPAAIIPPPPPQAAPAQ